MKCALAQLDGSGKTVTALVDRMISLQRLAADQGCDVVIFPLSYLRAAAPCHPDALRAFIADISFEMSRLIEALACPCIVPLYASSGPFELAEVLYITPEGVTHVACGLEQHALEVDDPQMLVEHLEEQGLLDFGSLEIAHIQDALELKTSIICGDMTIRIVIDAEGLSVLNPHELDADMVVLLNRERFMHDVPSSAGAMALSKSTYADEARRLNCWIASVQGSGFVDWNILPGSSFVVNPQGELVVAGRHFFEDFLIVDLADPLLGMGISQTDTALDTRASSDVDHLTHPSQRFQTYEPATATWQALCLALERLVVLYELQGLCVYIDNCLHSQLLLALALDAVGARRVWVTIDSSLSDDVYATLKDRCLSAHIAEDHMKDVLDPQINVLLNVDERRAVAEKRLQEETGALLLLPDDKLDSATGMRLMHHVYAVVPFGDLMRSDVVTLAFARSHVSSWAFDFASAFEHDCFEGYGQLFSQDKQARMRELEDILGAYIAHAGSINALKEAGYCEERIDALRKMTRPNFAARALSERILPLSEYTLSEDLLPRTSGWSERVRSAEELLQENVMNEWWNAQVDALQKPTPQEEVQKQNSDTIAAEPQDIQEVLRLLQDLSFTRQLSRGLDDDTSSDENHETFYPFGDPFSLN